MQDYLKEVGELVAMSEQAILRDMPEGLSFNHPGSGFEDGLMKSAILCTARSGSSLLSVALEAYGFEFKEYLNSRSYLKEIVTQGAITRTSDMAQPFARHVGKDGRMSIKMPVNGLPYLFMMGEFPRNIGQWRFVYLRRGNLVRQAISSVVARKTGRWTKVMAGTGQISDDDYAFDEIMKIVNGIAQLDRVIERFVGLFGIPTYNVVYEDFIANQKPILADIAQFLGTCPANYPEAENHEPWLERQSTDLNDRWESRFREELLSRFRSDVTQSEALAALP